MNVNFRNTLTNVFIDTSPDVLWYVGKDTELEQGEHKTKVAAQACLYKWLQSTQDQSIDVIEEGARVILESYPKLGQHSLRYRPRKSAYREELAKLIFDVSFASQPQKIIAAAKQAQPKKEAFYPLWKNVCWIKIPKIPAQVFDNKLVKVAITIGVIYFTFKIGYKSYDATTGLVAKGIPLLINHTPLRVIQMGNALMDCKDYILERKLKILLCSWLCHRAILLLPKIPYVTKIANKISIWSLFHLLFCSPQTTFSFLCRTAFSFAVFVWTSCTEMSQFFQKIVKRSENEMMRICKSKAYEVWKMETKVIVPSNI